MPIVLIYCIGYENCIDLILSSYSCCISSPGYYEDDSLFAVCIYTRSNQIPAGIDTDSCTGISYANRGILIHPIEWVFHTLQSCISSHLSLLFIDSLGPSQIVCPGCLSSQDSSYCGRISSPSSTTPIE